MTRRQAQTTVAAPPAVQRVLDRGLAAQFAAYIRRQRERNRFPHTGSEVTLAGLCRRFRVSQAVARRVIASVNFLAVSEYAYRPTGGHRAVPLNSRAAAQMLVASFLPQHWTDAPWGLRLVVLLDGEDGVRPSSEERDG